MPEGPEVTKMTDELRQKFKGSILENITILSGRYTKSHFPLIYKTGKIIDICNHGKFIWLKLADNKYIWLTLGLTGYFTFRLSKYARIKFETSNGVFYLDDLRNFGTIRFKRDVNSKLEQLGPDPLKSKFTYQNFINTFNKQNPRKKIAIALLDQKFIAGIGNYLRAEILYKCKINPYTQMQSIETSQKKCLFSAIKYISRKSYKGPKIKFKVYRQKYDPYGNVIKAEKIKDRTIWWVPQVQNQL